VLHNKKKITIPLALIWLKQIEQVGQVDEQQVNLTVWF
jgi:hypothetical protein